MLLECLECGWRGEDSECNKVYESLPTQDVEPSLRCPKCGSPNLWEIGGDSSKLMLQPA